MQVDFVAEKITDFGNITGSGLGNLLGAPKLSPLELLIREAVQNSWDARLRDTGPVHFGIRYHQLVGDRLRFLQKRILHSCPPTLKQLAVAPQVPVLILSDRGTKGLAGPIRTTEAGEGPRDFVNFVYMIGETKPTREDDRYVSGGSYGYGRSSFFRASRAKTIFLHSRTYFEGRLQSRFIGISWLDRYNNSANEPCTGRHWWGARDGDWVGPLVDLQADIAARKLGMDVAAGLETGTTIMILDPYLGADSTSDNIEAGNNNIEDASPVEQVVSSILWNCWPRMVEGGLEFELFWEDERIKIPAPQDHARIRLFVKAFKALRSTQMTGFNTRVFPIELRRPITKLGLLGLSRRGFQPDTRMEPCSPVKMDEPLRHVALMRNTLLVLNYTEVTAVAPADSEQFAGAFVVNPKVEEVFARSEPPSHDNWVKERLTVAKERSMVNVALKRIQEKAQLFIKPHSPTITPENTHSLARLSDRLADLLPGIEEQAKGRQHGSSRPTHSTPASPRPSPTISLDNPRREVIDKFFILKIPFSVKHLPDSAGTTATFTLTVALGGDAIEGSPPHGAKRPTFKSWRFNDGELNDVEPLPESLSFEIPPDVSGGIIEVAQPIDCQLRIIVRGENISPDV